MTNQSGVDLISSNNFEDPFNTTDKRTIPDPESDEEISYEMSHSNKKDEPLLE